MLMNRSSVLAVCAALMLSGVACSDRQAGTTASNALSGNANSPTRQVGHQVGDITPDFSIQLTNGNTVSDSIFRSGGMPIFLFFFSPF